MIAAATVEQGRTCGVYDCTRRCSRPESNSRANYMGPEMVGKTRCLDTVDATHGNR